MPVISQRREPVTLTKADMETGTELMDQVSNVPQEAAGPAPEPPRMSELPAPYQLSSAEAQQRNRIELIRNVFNKLPANQAISALTAAQELEGKLGYEYDVQAGVPQMEALTKWAPKIFARNPNAMLHAMQPKFEPSVMEVGGRKLIRTSPNQFHVMPEDLPTGDLQGRPIKSQEGEIIGYDAPGAKHVIKPSALKEGATIREQIMLNNARLRAIEKQMEAPGIIQNKARQAELVKQYDDISNELAQLGKKKSSKPVSPDSGGIPTVASKEEYDALPSGAIYLNEKSNRKHRKP